jgi:hypothetical protein
MFRKSHSFFRTGTIVAGILLQACAPQRLVPCEPEDGLCTPTTCTWYMTECFSVHGSRIAGLPVTTLDPSWTAAMELTEAGLPETAVDSRAALREGRSSFSYIGDFNGDDRRDRASVGVYRASDGSTGRYVLVLTEAVVCKWELAFLRKVPGTASYSKLALADGQLRWWMCDSCDHGVGVEWTGKEYEIQEFEFGD